MERQSTAAMCRTNLDAYFRSATLLLAFRFAIFQAGIAARTLTLMQGCEERE